MTHNHYTVLGVACDAEFSDLRKAYRARAMECHPDRHGGDAGKEDEFKLLVEAFNVLSDPVRRQSYDQQIGIAQRTVKSGQPAFDMGVSPDDASAVLDTMADDILEELIVGNSLHAKETSLATLMLDLERTEMFCLYREAKTRLYKGSTIAAESLFKRYVANSPTNILGHYYLAKCLRANRKWGAAEKQLLRAIQIGATRIPPLQLNRIRRELAALRRNRPGILGFLERLFGANIPKPKPLPVHEQERRALNRAINRLAHEREQRKRYLHHGD